jgi:hypothetical protein
VGYSPTLIIWQARVMPQEHLDITYNSDNLSPYIINADEEDDDDEQEAFYDVGDNTTPNDGSLSLCCSMSR